MTEKTTAPLADFGAGDIASAGGKGAALGELVRQPSRASVVKSWWTRALGWGRQWSQGG